MLSKKRFENKDRLIKGISGNGHYKISVVKTTDVVKAAKEKHDLSLLNTVLLGRALTGVMLLASELKGEERIQLRFEGDGPIGFLIAEANRVGEIRGYVQRPGVELDYSKGDTELGQGIGVGVLTLKKTLYNEAEPRTSTIEIIKGNITDDLAYYLFQSEQVPSALLLDVGIDGQGTITEAGGLLVQRMPGAPEGEIDELRENLKSFPSLDELYTDGLYIDDIMKNALNTLEIKELDRQPVDFFCRCTRDRFMGALSMLNYDDLKEISDEGQELVCHFCNEHYTVSQVEIKKIMRQMKAKMN